MQCARTTTFQVDSIVGDAPVMSLEACWSFFWNLYFLNVKDILNAGRVWATWTFQVVEIHLLSQERERDDRFQSYSLVAFTTALKTGLSHNLLSVAQNCGTIPFIAIKHFSNFSKVHIWYFMHFTPEDNLQPPTFVRALCPYIVIIIMIFPFHKIRVLTFRLIYSALIVWWL